ncbi:MAG: response regulator transcription factor [Bacteroidia bacterium]
MRILVVEDEVSVCQSLATALSTDGFEVDIATTGIQGLSLATSDGYSLILLDIMLPGVDGLTICRELRANGNRVPIIFLTARGELQHKVAGLDAGADDYLAKPFEVAELLARVRAKLRRTAAPTTTLTVGQITLDQIARTVLVKDQAVDLSPTEFALLEHLMLGKGRTVSRASIMQKVWKQDFYDDKVIDVYVSGLRKKLGTSGKLILTDRGVGIEFRRLRTNAEVVPGEDDPLGADPRNSPSDCVRPRLTLGFGAKQSAGAKIGCQASVQSAREGFTGFGTLVHESPNSMSKVASIR